MANSSLERAIRRYLFAGVATAVFLVGGGGTLLATTEISGAVIASGTVVVDSSVKKVQHPTGGVIGKINVREGDRVKEGDVLLSLDETVTRANLAIVTKAIDEFNARLARLEAERDGVDVIIFSDDLLKRAASDPAIERMIKGEKSLFEFRKSARAGQKSQLRERIVQTNEEVNGLNQQKDAKRHEIDLITKELESVRKLWDQKLVSLDRITELERNAVRIEGEYGQLVASIAQAKGRGSEIELQIIQVDQDLRSEVATDMREVQGHLSEFVEREIAAEDQLRRVDLRSPQDGVVHDLAVHTVGGVVGPGEIMMYIVPIADKLTIEARIQPQDIDQLTTGQTAIVRLSAFDHSTTPELDGVVSNVSADLTVDQRTGVGYYTARIRLRQEELAHLDGLTLTPGMPAELFFPTGNRTALSYLIKPISDQVRRAFRDG